MSAPNTQVGAQFARKTAPTFVGYRVKRGTWQPVPQERVGDDGIIEDEDANPIHVSFQGNGIRATCEMYQETTSADLVTGQTIADTDGLTWVVLEARALTFGTVAARFAVTLFYASTLDATQVSS